MGSSANSALYGLSGVNMGTLDGDIYVANKTGSSAYGVRSYSGDIVINTIGENASIAAVSKLGNSVFGIGTQQKTVVIGEIKAGAVITAISELSNTAIAVYGATGVTIERLTELYRSRRSGLRYGVYTSYNGSQGYDIAIAEIGKNGVVVQSPHVLPIMVVTE